MQNKLIQQATARTEEVRRYRQGIRGILTSRYAKMLREAEKENLPIIGREGFIKFNLGMRDLMELCDVYRQSGYDKDLMPVIQLIEKKKGYVLGNFIWTTLGEKVNSGLLIKIIDEEGGEHVFNSVKQAERHFKLPAGVLYKPLRKTGTYKNLKVTLEF